LIFAPILWRSESAFPFNEKNEWALARSRESCYK
jgi:hypothetical protein